MSGDLEAIAAQRFEQIRIEFRRQVRIVGHGQIENLSRLFAADVIMSIAAAVVAGGAVAVGDAASQFGVYQRIERLVNGGKADVGNLLAAPPRKLVPPSDAT